MFDSIRKFTAAFSNNKNSDYEDKPVKMKGMIAVRESALYKNSLETSQIYLNGWSSFSDWEKQGYVIQEIEVLVRRMKSKEGEMNLKS